MILPSFYDGNVIAVSSNSIQVDDSSPGGLFVVLICFFIFGFLLTIAAQFLFHYFLDGQQGHAFDAPELLADVTDEILVEPASRFSPEDVVNIQLEGLGSTNQAVGIRQCFAFASPTNKSVTGPLTRFASMVHRPPYSVLLTPQELLIGKPEIHEDHASVTVTLLNSRGEVQAFVFLLGRQNEGEFSGCWMTEGVFPLQPLDPQKPVRAPTVLVPRNLECIQRYLAPIGCPSFA